MPSPSDCQPTYSDRGFAYWPTIEAGYGAEVDVHESSAAAEPHIWVAITAECHLQDHPHPHAGVPFGIAHGSASAHLSMEKARYLRDRIDAAIKHSEERFGG